MLMSHALGFHVASGEAPLLLRLDSVHPDQLGRGAETSSGFEVLADLQVKDRFSAEDALWVVVSARAEVAAQRTRLRQQARAALGTHLDRLRGASAQMVPVQASLGAPQQALQAAELLKERISNDMVEALWAQAHPPKGHMLRLLKPVSKSLSETEGDLRI